MDKKGLVMKVEKNYAQLMTADGNLVNVKKKGIPPRIGQIYSGTEYKNRRFIKFTAAVIILLIFIASAAAYYILHMAYNTVVIEARVCIQMQTNRKNIVIKAIGVNSSGRKILNKVDLAGQPLDNALISIIDEAKREKLIDKNFIDSNSKITLFVQNNSRGKIEVDNFEQYMVNNDLTLLINDKGTLLVNPKKKITNKVNNP